MNQDQHTNMNAPNCEQETLVRELRHQDPNTPLFLRDGSDGNKGNAQDEKDAAAE